MTRRALTGIVALPIAFLLVFFAYPFVAILWRALAEDPGALGRVLDEPRVRQVVWFTIWQAALSTTLTMLVGLPIAYVISRYRFRGRAGIEAMVLLPFVLPTVVVGLAFSGLPGSVIAIVAAHVFFNAAIVVRVVGNAWATLDPGLEDAADELGASGWRRVTAVLLPLARPAVLSAATLVFLFTFTSFGVVLLLGGPGRTTIEVEIFRRTSQFLDLSAAAALAVVQLVFVAALLLVDAVLSARAPSVAPIPGTRAPRTRLERSTLGAVVAGAIALVLLPLWGLLRRSLTGVEGLTLANFVHIGEGRRGGVFEIDPAAAIWTSLRAAAIACALAMTIGGAIAVAIGLGARARWIWAVVAVPLGVSAVTLGFGYVIAFDRAPLDLRGSPWLVPIAQALVATPFVVRILAPAIASAHATLAETAASLGASPWQTFRDVTLPASAGASRTAATFAFIVALGEFGATAFVVRADTPTVPVAIARLLAQPGASSVGQASALGVILLALTALSSFAIGRLPLGVTSTGARSVAR